MHEFLSHFLFYTATHFLKLEKFLELQVCASDFNKDNSLSSNSSIRKRGTCCGTQGLNRAIILWIIVVQRFPLHAK